MKKIGIGILVVVVLLLVWGWSSYNGFVSSNEAVTGQWAQVETQYQRRLDLIPNVVAAVKGIVKQEQAVFGEIADARTRYAGATSVDGKVAAANGVESAFARLMVIVENYPQLRSSESFQQLTTQLEGTENRISVERKRFNDTVQSFNVMTKRFPSSVIAALFGFKEHGYFQSAAGAEGAPKVEF